MATSKNKESYVKATSEGRLYIETADFFKVDKVQKMVATLMESNIYKNIEERKSKNANTKAVRPRTNTNSRK